MANEIKLQLSGTIENGNFKFTVPTQNTNYDQTTVGMSGGIFSIGTSEETVSFTDITTEGWLYMKNLDATNYVQWGDDSTGMQAIGRLEAGEWACFRMEPSGVLRMQANTAACKVEIYVFED